MPCTSNNTKFASQSESRKLGELLLPPPRPPIDGDEDEASAEDDGGTARSKPSSCRSKPSINRLSPKCPPSDSTSFAMLSFKYTSLCLVYTNEPWCGLRGRLGLVSRSETLADVNTRDGKQYISPLDAVSPSCSEKRGGTCFSQRMPTFGAVGEDE